MSDALKLLFIKVSIDVPFLLGGALLTPFFILSSGTGRPLMAAPPGSSRFSSVFPRLPPHPAIADRRIDLSARQYLMFIIPASFCKSTLLTALLFFSPPSSPRLLNVRFGQLLSSQTLFLSQHIGSKVSFIPSDSSSSVSSAQEGSAVRLDVQRWLVPLKNFRLLFSGI